MTTIADNLLELQATKQNIKTAIESKGQDLENVAFTEYANKIASISTREDLNAELNEQETLLEELTKNASAFPDNEVPDYLARSIDENAEPYEYEVPEYITQITENAFGNDLALTKLTINCPNMLNSRGYMCSNCKNLKEAYLPYMQTTTLGRDFQSCIKLVKLYVPRIKFLGNTGLGWCSSLKYLQCESLESLSMTQTMIGCSSFITLYTPKLTKFAGGNSTQGMTALKDVIIGTSNCTFNELLVAGVMEDANARFYVKPEYVETYKVATNWVTYADKIVGYEEQTIKKGDIISLTGGSSYELSISWYDNVEECANLIGNTLTAVDTGIVLVRVLDENGSVTNGIVYRIEEA